MDFKQYIVDIRERFRDKWQVVQEEAIGTAVAMLQEDIRNPDLNNPGVPPDTFMLRANQIGHALLESGFSSVAERLYQALLEETLKYRQESGSWRHAGALYANKAGARAAQSNIDGMVIDLLRAAEDDVRTYGVSKADSFAITGLLQRYFGNPVRDRTLKVVQGINPNVTLADIEALGSRLGNREYAFLAYVYLGLKHEGANREFPNEFSQLQVFSALRSLSSLLEVELKTIAGNLQNTLYPTMEALFSGKRWWSAFDCGRQAIGATRNSNRPVDDQLRDAISISPTDDESRFWKGLLIGYIVRNYTIHQLETQCALIQSYAHEALGHILHVTITAPRHT